MASSRAFVRQTAWISIIPQSIVLTTIIGGLLLIGASIKMAFVFGPLIYLTLSRLLKSLIPRNHRKGIQYIKESQYDLALVEFQKSFSYFSKHLWIDKYRYLVLLSSNRASFREMALINIAYCYGQLGDGERVVETYKKALELFPDSVIVRDGVKVLESLKNVKESS